MVVPICSWQSAAEQRGRSSASAEIEKVTYASPRSLLTNEFISILKGGSVISANFLKEPLSDGLDNFFRRVIGEY